MRILGACSLGGAGHLRPLVTFLDVARALGHEVVVVAPPALAQMVQETGHTFEPGGEPDEAVVAPIREQLPVAPPHEASVLGNRELFGRLATEAMLPAMEHVLAQWRPALVLRDPCEYASAVASPPLGLAPVQVAIGLAAVEWGSITVASPALEAHRPGVTNELRAAPYVTRFPAPLDPSPFSDTRRYREPEPVAGGGLPDWWNGRPAPLVYMSFGTVLGHMSMAAEIYRVALQAVEGLDVRVLLTTGRAFDASQLGSVPSNVHVEPWVDQDEMLVEADVVVCHGGSGTTFGALGAGIPLVIVPLFADQRANATSVASAGAGVVVDTRADQIAQAIRTVSTQPSYRAAARRIAGELAAAPAANEVLDALVR